MGSYILSSLKSVSSSEEFNEMGESVRKCQFEQSWAECRRRLYREQVFRFFLAMQQKFIPENFQSPGKLEVWLLPSRIAAKLSFQLSPLLPSRHLLLQVVHAPSHPFNSYIRNYSLPSMSCMIPCHGLYSDVEHEAAGETIELDTPGMAQLMKEYQAYKRGNLHDPVPYLEGWSSHILHLLKSTSGVEPELKLHVVNIFFNTPTVDEITKDAKTNIMTQISVIGGTLGLFTGFSIMSGFEILYFVVRIALGMLEKSKETRKDLKGR